MENISEVVASKACSSCGICVAACPVDAITIEEASRPSVLDSCNNCGICHEICPRVEMPYATIEKDLAAENQAGYHDDLLGFYTRIFLARSADTSIRKVGYSGATTTAFICFLLQRGLIDAALLTDKAHRLPYCAHPYPRVATTPDDVISCAFTKPTVNPILACLPVKADRIAFVGNSCHLEAIRKAQFMAEHGKASKKRCRQLVGNIKYLVGLTCFFTNNPNGVDQQLAGLGLKEHDIKRFFYAKEMPSVELPDGTIKSIPRSNENFDSLNLGCLLCYPSYTSRLSDVTFGKTMSEEWGWNDVVCRSRAVEDILIEMEKKGVIESKDANDGGAELFQSLLEAGVFKTDALGYAQYLQTGRFSPEQTASEMMNRPGGTIKGITRMKLIQAVRKFSFYEPAVSARKAQNVFVPSLK